MLRVLCRYLMRVSDRIPPTTDQPYITDAHRAVLRDRRLRVRWSRGMGWSGLRWGRRKGRGIRGVSTHPCASTSNSRALVGPGPSPLAVPRSPSLSATLFAPTRAQYSAATLETPVRCCLTADRTRPCSTVAVFVAPYRRMMRLALAALRAHA